MKYAWRTLLPLATVWSVVVLHAQSPASTATGPAFEVASVKPNNSGPTLSGIRVPPGRFTVINMTLRSIVTIAYGLQDFQLLGAPKWIDDERFDIDAKMPEGAPQAQKMLMVRMLLAERFKLAVRTEPRDGLVYALVMARNDGRFGSGLRRPLVDCETIREAARRSTNPSGQPPTQPADRPACGIKTGPGTIKAGGVTLGILTNILSRQVDRTVVDRTGLTGTFDIELEFAPESLRPLSASTDPSGNRPQTDDRPSIFSALQDQLGLKLDSQKAPADYIVVDHVERPTEN